MAVTNFYTIDGQMIGYDGGGGRKDFLTDTLGSITAEVDQTGAVKTFDGRYKPFGADLSHTGMRGSYGWVGSWGYRNTNISASSHYVRARHYSLTDGAWTSKDPTWPDEHSYVYVNGRTLLISDYSGQSGGQGIGLLDPEVIFKGFPKCWPTVVRCGPKPPPAIFTCEVIIIAVGVVAAGDLVYYCCTGKPGPVTGIGVAIGAELYPDPKGDPDKTRLRRCQDNCINRWVDPAFIGSSTVISKECKKRLLQPPRSWPNSCFHLCMDKCKGIPNDYTKKCNIKWARKNICKEVEL